MALLRKIRNLLLWLIGLFLLTSIGAVVAYRFLPVPLTPLMVIRLVEQAREGRELRLQHEWVSLDEMSADLPLAVWATEDQNFLTHHGFDFKAISEAIDEAEKGGRRRGASTISQQTAKNVFLWPDSSWLRKGFEVYFTLLIELIWDKHRIMEVYLNSIEMGDGIYGAEAVAQAHFSRSASQLTREQCALIAVSLPNPLKFDSAHPSAYLLKRQAWALRQMRFLVKFPDKEEVKSE